MSHNNEEGGFALANKIAIIIDPGAFAEPVTTVPLHPPDRRQGEAYRKAAQIIALVGHRLGVVLD